MRGALLTNSRTIDKAFHSESVSPNSVTEWPALLPRNPTRPTSQTEWDFLFPAQPVSQKATEAIIVHNHKAIQATSVQGHCKIRICASRASCPRPQVSQNATVMREWPRDYPFHTVGLLAFILSTEITSAVISLLSSSGTSASRTGPHS